jgi:filamentous hemagglutinin family protein
VRQTGKSVRVFKSGADLGSARIRAIPFALAIAFGSTSSFADPAGGAVAAGQASISAMSGVTTIHQISDRAVVNWQSFNVNAGEVVKFIQPSSTAAILNRVTGGSVSNINGLVEGNGRVYLINPNGIVVGANGVVNVNGGFVGSTKSLADSAFMSGGALVFTGESTGSIQILGKVQSAQGDVILIAPKIAIEKTGSLIAGQTIKLVAANEVELSNGKFTVKPKVGDAGQLTIEGALEAAKVQLAANNNNLGALAINTTGTIRATGSQTNPDGSVSIIATGDGGNINISGNIRSEKVDGNGGAVTVLADNNIRISGIINANSTDSSKVGGDIYIGRDVTTNKLAKATDVSGATLLSNKGFVETSGEHLATDGISIKAAEWLLDPSDITISNSANSNVTGVSPADITPNGGTGTSSIVQVSTIQGAINAGTNVTIKTTNVSNATGEGNITIADALAFANNSNTNATLSLVADNGITQNAGASITTTAVTGKTGLVNISMTANGNYQGNTAASANSKGITLNAGITTNGSITLTGNNQSGATLGTGAGVYINRQTLNAGTSDVTITGTATNGSGVFINGDSAIRGRNIAINGTGTTTAAANSGIGVYLYRDATTTIAATNNLEITGTVTGSGTGNGLRSNGGNVGTAVLMTAGGTATLKGIQTGNPNNTSSAVYLSGFRVNATGNVTIQAEAASSNSLAIHMAREAGALNGYDDAWRMQVRSSGGDVLIQSNQGAILGQDTSGGVNISGRNVILDNTGAGMTINGVANANGGAINTTTGAIVLGSGTSTYSTSVANGWAGSWVPLGVSLNGQNSTANVTATGNLTIGGSSSAAQGVAIGSAMTVTGDINLAGRSSAANTNGLNITQALTTAGNINLTGESTNASPGVGINVGAEVKTTGTTSTTTLTSTTGAISGTGNITTAVGNTGTITVNTATGGTLSGVISGAGSLVKQGAGTTILTGTNSYAGTTTISAGTLQIGNSSTTGSLGLGSVTNNANLTFNRSNAMTVANAIDGTGALSQAGAGTTILTGTNSYAGTTTISAGTLQIGNGGATGTLGSGVGNVVLSNGTNLVYNRNVDTVVNNAISGNGNVSATITGNLDVAKTINLSTSGNTVNLTASGNVSQSAGSISATNLYLTATNGSIGTSTNRINTSVSNLAMTSSGNQFATQANALSLAARTTGTGNIDVKTTNGTLTITSVNGINGVTATGSGTITLSGTSNTAGGLLALKTVAADTGKITLIGTATGTNGTGLNIGYGANVTSNGDVDLTGTTTANNRPTAAYAGVINAGTVTGKNISLTATAYDTAADVLGYYGAGGNLIATEKLKGEAESKGAGVGFYMYSGKTQSGNGMDIKGTGNRESGFGLDAGAQVLNKVTTGTASGDVVLTGSTNSSTHASIGLYRATIENTSTDGGIQITATKGDILASYGAANTITNAGSKAIALSAGPSSAIDVGAINGTNLTITQNGNGGVEIKTSGTGNVTAPKIINKGTSNVIVAAGTAIGAGTGTGGQVKTVAGNTISQTNVSTPGKTYIYTGNATDTGLLSNLSSSFNTLQITGDATQNTDSNRAFDNAAPISGSSADAQVIFREKLSFAASPLSDAVLSKTYGDASTKDSALNATLLDALKNVAGNAGAVTIGSAGSNQIMVSKSVVTDSLTTTLANNLFSTSGFLKADTSGANKFNMTSTKYNVGTDINVTVNVAPLAVSLSNLSTTRSYNGALLSQSLPVINNRVGTDTLSILTSSLAKGRSVGSYVSALALDGSDAANYSISDNGTLVISYGNKDNAPTSSETYTRIASDVVNLAPVSFAVGVAAATAAGDEADPNICYAWVQRNGGAVIVHTVLKPAYLGLRDAKTDAQEAMGNGGASSAHSASPCGHDVATNVAQSNNI